MSLADVAPDPTGGGTVVVVVLVVLLVIALVALFVRLRRNRSR